MPKPANRIGRLFLGIAAILVICATAIGWVVIERIESGIDRNAALAEEAAQLGIGTAEAASMLGRDVTDLANAVADGIEQLDEIALQTETTTAQLAEVSGGGLRAVSESTADALARLAIAVDTLETALASLAFLGVPQPEAGLADDLSTAASELEPIAGDLEEIAANLRAGSRQLAELRGDLASVRSVLAALTADLGDATDQVEPVAERVEAARVEIREFRSSTGLDTTLWRAALVVVALGALATLAGIDRLTRYPRSASVVRSSPVVPNRGRGELTTRNPS